MREFGLIGKALSHSFSKEFFLKKFHEEQIHDADYHLFPIDSAHLISELIASHPNLQGLNITIPFKSDVIPFLTFIDTEAEAIGAVNCIKIVRSTDSYYTKGYNTDIYGFANSLEPLLTSWHTSALVLGSGGAAKAVMYVLKAKGISAKMVSRKNSTDSISYNELTEALIKENHLIVNTTPLGMYPHIDDFPPIPYQALTEKHLLFDLTYNPEITQFLAKGRNMGTEIKNGKEMLELQALKSWEIWTQNETFSKI